MYILEHVWTDGSIKQEFDEDDQTALAAAEKRQRRSLRFATLTAKLELFEDEVSEDKSSDDENVRDFI